MTLSAITLFCDDIRFESNGQRTLVGLYSASGLAGKGYVRFSGLHMITFLRGLKDQWPENITVSLALPGEEPDTFTIPRNEIEKSNNASEDRPDASADGLRTVELRRHIEGFQVEESSAIEVTVVADGVGIPAGRLELYITEPSATPKERGN